MHRLLALLLPLALLISFSGGAAPARPTSARSVDRAKFDGKTVSQWLQQLRTDSSDKWNEAASALMMNGDKAIVPLTRALEDHDARVRRGAAQGLRQLTSFPRETLIVLRKHLRDPSLLVRADVCETLMYAKDDVVPVVAAVRSVLASDDPATREAVLYVLHLMPLDEQPCLDLVLEALKHGDPSVRFEAADALEYEEDLKEQVAGPLRQALVDPDLRVRMAAASSCWKVTGDPAPLPGLLLEALKNTSNAETRAAAAGVLAQIGEQAKETFGALATAALSDPDADVRKAAAAALPELHAGSDTALPIFVKLLEDRRGSGWEGALRGLIDLGPVAMPVLPKLLPELLSALRTDPSYSEVPLLAAEAVGMIGPAARQAVPLLVRLMNWQDIAVWPDSGPSGSTPQSRLQQAALSALSEVAPAEALPHLIKSLQNKNAWVVQSAADAIASIGPPAREAAMPLAHAIVTEDDKVDYYGLNESLFKALLSVDEHVLIQNLIKIGQKRPYALMEFDMLAGAVADPAAYITPLVRLLKAGSTEPAERAAAMLLGSFGANTPTAAEALGQLLGDKSANLQIEVAQTLQAMGPAAKPALPYLLARLKATDDVDRWGAIGVLEAIGPEAVAAAPRLLEIVRERRADDIERVSAAFALKAVGGKTEDLVAPLTEIVETTTAQARAGAAELLGDIGPSAATAIPSLQRALATGKPYVRTQAAQSLWLLTGDVSPVLPALREVATGEVGPAKVAAVLLLGRMGPAANSMMPLLQGLADGPSPTIAMAATLSLAGITGDRSTVPTAVVKAARATTPEDSVNELMLQTMLEPALKPVADELVKAVVAALEEDGTDQEQTSLIAFLPMLGPAAQAAEPELRKLGASGDEYSPGGVARRTLTVIRQGPRLMPMARDAMRYMGDKSWRFPTPD